MNSAARKSRAATGRLPLLRNSVGTEGSKKPGSGRKLHLGRDATCPTGGYDRLKGSKEIVL